MTAGLPSFVAAMGLRATVIFEGCLNLVDDHGDVYGWFGSRRSWLACACADDEQNSTMQTTTKVASNEAILFRTNDMG